MELTKKIGFTESSGQRLYLAMLWSVQIIAWAI